MLVTRERELVTHAQHHLERASCGSARSEAVVRALDPRRVLERGYSITRDADGRVVRTQHTRSSAGALVDTELAAGPRHQPRRDHHRDGHHMQGEPE